jgi:hypothetical protein
MGSRFVYASKGSYYAICPPKNIVLSKNVPNNILGYEVIKAIDDLR